MPLAAALAFFAALTGSAIRLPTGTTEVLNPDRGWYKHWEVRATGSFPTLRASDALRLHRAGHALVLYLVYPLLALDCQQRGRRFRGDHRGRQRERRLLSSSGVIEQVLCFPKKPFENPRRRSSVSRVDKEGWERYLEADQAPPVEGLLEDLAALQAGGVKAVVRCAYSDSRGAQPIEPEPPTVPWPAALRETESNEERETEHTFRKM